MSPFTPEIIKVLQDDARRRGEHMSLVAEVRKARKLPNKAPRHARIHHARHRTIAH